jgi:hypothetical protein
MCVTERIAGTLFMLRSGMFLQSDTNQRREAKVREYLGNAPSISLVLAAINFEWTVCRAVLFLSTTPNAELRTAMAKFYSLDAYKDLWKQEVLPAGQRKRLAEVVRNWSAVRKAFTARNVLVHGRDRYTRNMAIPHVEALLAAVRDVDDYCLSLRRPLHGRMPIRRKRRAASSP